MGKGTQSTTTVNQPPPQVMAAYEQAMQGAQTAASAPYQNYGGQLQAGFSPDQLSGFQSVEGAQGAANPYINTASRYLDQSTGSLMNGVQQFSPGAISQYQSPYIQQVVDATQAQFNNQNAQAANQLKGNAASAGALGGDRAGVAQAALAGQQQTAQAPVIAGLNQSGYNTALGEFNNQQQLQYGANVGQAGLAQNAASGFSNLGNQALNTQLTGANALLGAGQLQQQQAQTSLNIPYQQFLAQQAYPFQTSQFYTNAAEGLGSGMGGSSTQTQPQPSILSQGLGLATGVAGLVGALSDRRLKEDIKKIGHTNDGQPIYSFRYKGEPQTQIGLMAQDVAKKHPEAVDHAPSGFMMVDYKQATKSSERASGGAVSAGPANITMQASGHAGGIAIPIIGGGSIGPSAASAVPAPAVSAPSSLGDYLAATKAGATAAASTPIYNSAIPVPAPKTADTPKTDPAGFFGLEGGDENSQSDDANGGGFSGGDFGGPSSAGSDPAESVGGSGNNAFAQGGSIPYQTSALSLGAQVPDLMASVVPTNQPQGMARLNVQPAQSQKQPIDGGLDKSLSDFTAAVTKNKDALHNLFNPPPDANALAVAAETSPSAMANPGLYGPGFKRGGGLRGFAGGGTLDDVDPSTLIPDPNTGGLTQLPPPLPPEPDTPGWYPGRDNPVPAPTPPPVVPTDPDQTDAARALAARIIARPDTSRVALAGDALGRPIAPAMGSAVPVRELPATPATPPVTGLANPSPMMVAPAAATLAPAQKSGFDINAVTNSPWMALANAGFAAAAGRSPYPMANLAAGAQSGLQYLTTTPQRQLAQTQARAAAENLAATEAIRQQSGFGAGTPGSARVPGGVTGMASAGIAPQAGGVGGNAPPVQGVVTSSVNGQPLFDVGQQWNRANMLIASGVPDYVKAGQGLMTNLTAMIKEGVVPSRDGGVTPINGAAEAAARKAAMVAQATAPIDISKALVSQAGRPQTVSGDQTVTSGFNTLPPALQALVNRQLGIQGSAPAGGGYVQNVNSVESGGNPNARNPIPGQTSSGLGGFTDGTWLSTFKQAHPDVAANMSDQQILALKSNPQASQILTADYARINAPVLEQGGLPVNDASLYLAHHFGPQGAIDIAHAPANAPIESVIPPAVVALNPDIQGKTAGQVVQSIVQRFGTGAGIPQQQQGGAPAPAIAAPKPSFVPTASPSPGVPTVTQPPPDLPASPTMAAPQLVRNADGSLTATNTPGFKAIQTEIAKTVGAAPDALDKLAQSRAQLVTMQEEIAANRNAPGFLQSGFAGQTRNDFANATNTVLSSLGLKPAFSPTDVANNQAFLKNSNVAAFTLARQMSGGRVAVGEVLQANRSVPNQENSPYGNVVVSNLLMQENLRQTDRTAYIYDQAKHGSDPVDAARAFDTTNPPERYVSGALAASVKTFYPKAVETLLQSKPTPQIIAAFNHYWGAGTAQQLLATARP